MACGAALRVVAIWTKGIRSGVVLEHAVSPTVGVRESLGILLDELNLSERARHGVRRFRGERGIRELFWLPLDFGNLGAVGEWLAIARNALPVGFHHDGIR